ncbi:3-phosphoinositide-dependent protein kinase 2 isoform X2 [Cryptomeria japonica]|uniref:3-phosphoinositide-dependent protein kinase 2 isoform X2 n=1 Tax=Cryptomeria japonica TaxID=3369 RepID=UPI0027DA4D31|nr:3-phosphoinositide-dependent protein kinase 2 isoform X2 [Cryptomeria japonica]
MGDLHGDPALATELEVKLSLQDLDTAPATPPNRNSTTTNNNNVNGVETSGNDSGKSNGVQRSPSFAFRAPQEAYRMDDFETDRVLGVGSYSRVIRARKKDTGRIYALKIMDKRFIAKEKKVAYVKLERIVLDQLDHPGIIRLYFTFQDAYHIYMGLESCDGGELFDQISRKGHLSEDEARFYSAEIVDALEYLHKVGLIHRDVKPENVLLTADGHVKLADFGSVKPMENSSIELIQTTSNEKACTFVGTAAYVPPEVLKQAPPSIGNDLWALGCTLYQMLSGISPFKDASEWLTFQRVMDRKFEFPDYFSSEARDLIDCLLDMDPCKRLGTGPNGYASLKSHPFFKGIDWDNVRGMTAPIIAPPSTDNKEENAEDDDWLIGGVGFTNDETLPKDKDTTSSSSAEVNKAKFTTLDAFDSKWIVEGCRQFSDITLCLQITKFVKSQFRNI